MTKTTQDMARLMQVTEAAFNAQRAKMMQLTRREDAIRQQIAELTEPRPADPTTLQDDAAARAGADFLFQQWLDRRIVALNQEMAKLRVAKARLHGPLSKAFGKYQITGHLYEEARLAANRKGLERQERTDHPGTS